MTQAAAPRTPASAQNGASQPGSGAPFAISGVLPSIAVRADHVPRSETGIGALMPWADRLWFVT